MKVRVAAANAYFYKATAVACMAVGNVPDAPTDHLLDPKLIVEVPSPSTEATGLRKKVWAYGTLHGLSDYVLVDSPGQHGEVYRSYPKSSGNSR